MNLLLSIHPTLATSLPTSAPILTCLLCSNLRRPFESYSLCEIDKLPKFTNLPSRLGIVFDTPEGGGDLLGCEPPPCLPGTIFRTHEGERCSCVVGVVRSIVCWVLFLIPRRGVDSLCAWRELSLTGTKNRTREGWRCGQSISLV